MSGVDAQRAFAARIRQPAEQPLLAGVTAERMAVYEALFFNNIEGFISGAFPVLHRLIEASRWQRLVRSFIAEHQARTPYFLQISQEFLAWLQQGYVAEAGDPPFILELAHYEWVELALDVSEAEGPQQGWSPLAWPLAYVWPVQRIGVDFQPTKPPAGPTCLLVWRDGQDKVRFMQLSPFAYQLAIRLQAGEAAEQALLELAQQHGLRADTQYFNNAQIVLDDWQRQGIWRP
ncbi:MAG: putative DNA-binding domain-containing protein [Gammaproteobacteria bacterium]|nr:putative DNA-binding domain-containing protein [Gammaproteobacteria bacterium]MBU1488164.1 putative DNA-binding domain-containing protein [Gammaproteobacteria bacterium]MBU2066175.1 putative DNA-binding domain-containing protein [Gammaproteobacteria bacterium]MBU2139462.1 putative DNA-binding domain-containing protein [Gammaproteobacteria bacterium]MBU2215716.1 putative DNA-binding domain-containing protein [Gammaproteobacteria bacterium]